MKKLTVLFLVKEKRVLLAMKKRGFGAGRWNGVGGKVEKNETTEQATVRECQEEIKVTPLKLDLAAEIIFHERHEGKRATLFVSVFLSNEWAGSPSETAEMSPKWFAIDRIPYNQMWADDPHWLPQVLKGNKLRCEFTLDKNDQVIKKSVELVDGLLA